MMNIGVMAGFVGLLILTGCKTENKKPIVISSPVVIQVKKYLAPLPPKNYSDIGPSHAYAFTNNETLPPWPTDK